MKKTILAATYGGGHVNIMIPVLRKLQSHPGIALRALGFTLARDLLNEAGFPSKGIMDYYDPDADRDILPLGDGLMEKFHIDGKGISLEESRVYLGFALRDLIAQCGRKEAERQIEEKGKKAFLQLDLARRIFDVEKPDLLLTGNCPRMERALTHVAGERKIPSINIHDYLAFDKRHKLEADRIAVMSDITRENLIASGHDADRIVVTGQPAFDSAAQELASKNRGEICARLEIDPSKRYITLGTQSADTTPQLLGVTASIVRRKHPDLRLIVKPHPGEDSRIHEKLIGEMEFDALLRPGVPIRDLIFVSEFLITFFSTIGFEAALMKKPLLSLNFWGGENPAPLHKFGLGLEARTEEEAEIAFERLLNDPGLNESFNRSLTRHFGSVLDGRGAERAADLALDLLNLREAAP